MRAQNILQHECKTKEQIYEEIPQISFIAAQLATAVVLKTRSYPMYYVGDSLIEDVDLSTISTSLAATHTDKKIEDLPNIMRDKDYWCNIVATTKR